MGVKAALPRYELYLYTLVLALALVWSTSWIFQVSSTNTNRKQFKASVTPGWHYIGRKMDTADSEWMMWFSSFWEHILFALSGHVIFAKICSMLALQHRTLMFLVYGLLAVWCSMGLPYVMLLLWNCVLLYSVALAKLPWLCVGTGLGTLATLRLEPLLGWQSGFAEGSFALRPVLFYGGVGFTIMRCMSFALENCSRPEGNYSLLELLKYNFYLPYLYFGPVMTFDKFYLQANKLELHRKDREMWNISLQAMVCVGAIIMVDFLLHFMYIMTIPTDVKLLKHLSDWAIGGLAYLNLLYDWLKSAVMFGLISTVARLDHLDPPTPPKCITLLYVFSETHFDRGINDWLCKYVYNRLGGKHDVLLEELLASVCTFGVALLWLGPGWAVCAWAALNCLGLNLELWTAKLFTMEPFISIEMAMSEAMVRRVRALFNTLNFCTIILYNLLTLSSLEFTKLVAKRLLLKGFPFSTLTLLFVTYCLVQLIKEAERRQALIDDPDPTPPPAPTPADTATPIGPAQMSAPPTQPVDPSKEKAE